MSASPSQPRIRFLVKVVPAHRAQVRHIADDLVMIGMDPEGGLLDGLTKQEHGLVLAAFPLRHHDSPFGREFLLLKQAMQHAVRLKTQCNVDLVGGHRLEVGGPIEEGEGVARPSLAGDGLVDDLGWKPSRPLELHVLDEVGDSGQRGRLIPRTNAIPDPQ